MRKKIVFLFTAALAAAVCFTAVGCGDDAPKDHKVRFVNGDEVLKTVTVADGKAAEEWRPVKDGHVFKGWYTDANHETEYVFSGKVKKDIKVYAWFEKALSIRVKGSYITGWEHLGDAEYCMTYNAETDRYTYTHEFVEGDEFMFYNFDIDIGEDGKEHVVGLGKININSDSIYAEQSTENLILEPSSNIKVGKRGTYGFVYDDNTGKAVVTYDDKFESGYTANTEWYIAGGGITQPLKSSSFGHGITDEHKFTPVADKTGVYVLTLDLAKGDLFQVVASEWYARAHKFNSIVNPTIEDTEYFAKRLDNIEVMQSGNYTLTLTCDLESPLDDKIEWVRNGDVIQELPIIYDVFMKTNLDEWKPSDRNTAVDGVVKINTHFVKDEQFCFIYYDPGVDFSEVGSFANPGSLITNAMKGAKRKSNYNDQFGDFENNFVCIVEGYYVVEIDFNEGTPKVNFKNFSETIPECELIIKGPAYNGDPLWSESERYKSKGGIVEITLILTKGDTEALSEFGFTWWYDDTDKYGIWVGTACIGTDGDANALMVVEGQNNFVCKKTGKYRIVINVFCGSSTVDFYAVE